VFDGLDDDGWAAFLEALEERLAGVLRSGAWRAAGGADRGRAGLPKMGESCPAF
jgi:hypothetical protein